MSLRRCVAVCRTLQDNGVTALLHACRGGSLDIVTALLKHGATGWLADVRSRCLGVCVSLAVVSPAARESTLHNASYDGHCVCWVCRAVNSPPGRRR